MENSDREGCVWGSQGSPQESGWVCGPAKTPGSSMNRRAVASAACRTVQRVVIFVALAAFLAPVALLHAQSARKFFKRGQAAEVRGEYDAALSDYQKAMNKDPKDLRYRTAFYRVRGSDSAVHLSKGRRLLAAGNLQGALEEFLRAAAIDPSNEAAEQAIAEVRSKSGEVTPSSEVSVPMAAGEQREIDSMGAPPHLKVLSNEPLTMHMTEDSKVIYEAIGKAAGINVIFDPDYHSQRIQVDLANVSLMDALRIVATISNTFWRPVTSNTIFVAQDTRAKRMELDEEAVQTFYLSNAWQQNDLTDIQTAIRNVLTNVRAYAVASQNAIVIRGTPDELLLAQKLIDDLDKPRPEVVVDISVLEVSKNWERTLGIEWPTSVGVTLQSPEANSTTASTTTSTTTTVSPTLYDLSHLKASDFAVTIGTAQANLLLTDSHTKTLENPRIRATDSQKATMKIGERIPIATGSYQTGAATALVSSLVNTQFQYIDIGVNIEMTPTIHYDGDVTLKLKIEDSSEGSSVNISGVTEPIIIQKVVDQVIRLREGEAAVLGGIQENQSIESWNGIPGLSSIPILRYLFGSKDHTINTDDLVFLVVPHIVRGETLNPMNLRAVDTGAGQSIQLRYVPVAASVPHPGPGAEPVSMVRQPSYVHPELGTVPGQGAMEAAPAALAQLNQAAQMNSNPEANSAPAAPPQSAKVSLLLTPQSAPVSVGSTFKIPVVLSGGSNIASVPMQIQYDPTKLSLVNVDSGNFLDRDGQPVALVHRDDGSGNLTVVASRPPGAAGVSGTGVVCVLSFQARAAGATVVSMTRPEAVTSTQQRLEVQGGQITVQVK
ncbi:MAG: cohesin domain-containing protein [Terracidiphilus sp.]